MGSLDQVQDAANFKIIEAGLNLQISYSGSKPGQILILHIVCINQGVEWGGKVTHFLFYVFNLL